MSEARNHHQEGLLFEYEQLKREVLQNDSIAISVLGATVALSGVLITVAFSEAVTEPLHRAAIFFMVVVIALLGLIFRTSLAQSNYLIGSYLRQFVEPELEGVFWETRLRLYRNQYSLRKDGPFVVHDYPVYTLINVTGAIFAAYYSVRTTANTCVVVLMVVIAFMLVAACALTLRHADNLLRDTDGKFDRLWSDAENSRLDPGLIEK